MKAIPTPDLKGLFVLIHSTEPKFRVETMNDR